MRKGIGTVLSMIVESYGTKTIRTRVKHPQTNGKLERVISTLFGLRKYFDSWEEVVYYYNYKRNHMSLVDDRPVVTPYMACKEKMKNRIVKV